MTTPPPSRPDEGPRPSTEPNRPPERGRHRRRCRGNGVLTALGIAGNIARLAYYVWRLASDWWH